MGYQGKLFVIDGTDGSGKATQTKLLIARMKDEGYPVETVSFPRYGQKSAGLVEDYLAGVYGDPTKLDARIASIFYAADRFAASRRMREWLEAGFHVVADRYVSSNMGHQGGKFADRSDRRAFLRWNSELEFGTFGIPKPDLTIILHVPAEIGQQLANNRDGQGDGHQKDIEHLRHAEATYLEIAAMDPERFRLIECVKDGRLFSREEIHELIWQTIKPLLTRS